MLSALLAGAVLLAADPGSTSAAGPDDLTAYRAASAKVGRDPDAHVRLALWCEAHGLPAERLKHLALAVLTDPKHAAARGLMGLVAYRGRWERPEAVGEKVRADSDLAATMAEYNALRETAKTAEGHWRLALWCEKNGLKAEEIAHLTAVTRLDPSRDAAWKRLGCKPFNGRWMTDEQIAALKSDYERQKQADRHWRPLLEKLRDRLNDRARRDSAETALSEVTDPRAVPAVWAVFAVGDEPRQLVAARLLGQIDSGGASRALAALAVFSSSAHVRRVSTETLMRRDPRDFVSMLIGLLRDPIKYEVRPVAGPGSDGVLFIEGKQFNVRRIYSAQAIPDRAVPPRLFAPSVPFDPFNDRNVFLNSLANASRPGTLGLTAAQNISGTTGVEGTVLSAEAAAVRRDMQIAAIVNRYQQAAAVTQARLASDVAELEAANAAAHEVNGMTLSVLGSTTGQELGESADSWKTWWSDQQGYKYEITQPAEKPTFTQVIETPSAQVHHSCFAAGTPVRTLDGSRPIESIRVGDQVLSQDVQSGALSFEPVLAVFHNKPASTLRVELEGKEAIVATRIHRFWKANHGWTMARDLRPGDAVRTVDGLARVVSVEADLVQPVYNLEVSHGQSFFVGTRGTLVHDNSLVTPALEPFDAAPALATAVRRD